ncbi:hypothetical protein L6164_000873 [Bauhinia variegata]|uniref:Uncharacterized protein n=1 Tax=Bauhinia variegata TaxID=167791 RepID=A0ACB9Q7E4_BAUVA|nr:hypothetical protein L6164_000873 [Bauhinia variegata]
MSKPRPLTEVKVAGTDGYLAPECIISNTLTEKCDVYSFGMVLLVVVCAKVPRSILEKMRQSKNQDVDEAGSESESGS